MTTFVNGGRLGWTSFAALVAVALAVPASFRAAAPVANYTGIAVPPGAVSASTPVRIVIERWSTNAEQQQLLTALAEKGSGNVLKMLQKNPRIGSLAATGSIGVDIKFASRSTSSGVEHVLLLTDRPMGFFERATLARSSEYPFMAVMYDIGPTGRGKGEITVAAKMRLDRIDGTIQLENFDVSPVALNDVRKSM